MLACMCCREQTEGTDSDCASRYMDEGTEQQLKFGMRQQAFLQCAQALTVGDAYLQA